MVRGHASEPEHVVVLATLGAPERRALRRRRSRTAEPEPDPAPVTTTRATVVDVRPVGDSSPWLRDDPAEVVATALDVLNRILQAQRIAAADPYAREVREQQALVVRVGVGEGEQVAHGRWTEARELPPVERRRRERGTAALRPQERLAALLGGRDAALACEELVIRARLDLDRGRHREAALQLRVALEAAIAELEPWSGRGDLDRRIADLRDHRHDVGQAANQALQGGLPEETIEKVAHVVGRIEAALRARTAGGFE